MGRVRILLVEDDAVISGLMAELLAELGHDVCGTARTERQAIEAAARHAPDLMIVDAYLLVGNGIAAMKTILQQTAMPHIFMTGGLRNILPEGSIVLCKPFGLAGLTAALDHVTAPPRRIKRWARVVTEVSGVLTPF